MRIKLDDTHTLCSDRWCCWIMEQRNNQKTGEPYEVRVSGFYRTYEEAATDYIETEFMGSAAEDLVALAGQLADLKKEVREWNRNKSAG